jgi:hypothetical protein
LNLNVQIVAADAPVSLALVDWGIHPLTSCCKASAKHIASNMAVCRGCSGVVDPLYVLSWLPHDDAGWSQYRQLLLNGGGVMTAERADEIAVAARQKVVAAVGGIWRP